MKLIADLHIHGRYSQATSKDLTIPNLEKWARIKGLDLMGTGDFTHPKWIQHIKESLKDEDHSGIYKTQSGFPFVLQTEISLIYTQGGKGRRIHHLVLAPNLDVVQQITDYLLTKGRVDYDGRPIFKIPSPEFVESLRKISEDIEVIPAHIWTPWFGMLGSKSGFDSFKECFQDQTKHVHAFETGLSSDPPMNWRLSQLDKLQILSFSDLHSFWPWRIGREAAVFDIDLKYASLLNAIRTGDGLVETIEVDPNYGKYHADGHRNCNISFMPEESRKHNCICPVCKKPLTIGVSYRVEELADRPEGFKPEHAKPFRSLISLSEIISLVMGKAITTKVVWAEYDKIRALAENELKLLTETPKEEIEKVTCMGIVDAIMLNRQGKIKVKPGYDGEYGVPLLGEEDNIKMQMSRPPEDIKPSPQKSLGDFQIRT